MEQRTKKVFIYQFGEGQYIRRLVAEVPVEWTDDDISCLKGFDLSRFQLIDIKWKATGDQIMPQSEFEVDELAPDDAVPDIIVDGPLPPPTESGMRNT